MKYFISLQLHRLLINVKFLIIYPLRPKYNKGPTLNDENNIYLFTIIVIYNLDKSSIDKNRLEVPKSGDDGSNLDMSNLDRWSAGYGKILKI